MMCVVNLTALLPFLAVCILEGMRRLLTGPKLLLLCLFGGAGAWRLPVAISPFCSGIRHQESRGLHIPSPELMRRGGTVTPIESRQAAGPAWVEASEGPIVFDLAHFGLFAVQGEDALRFLHNQLTNDFMSAKPGTVLESSYTTSLGRTIDLLTTFIISPDEVWVLCSPNRNGDIFKSMSKYIFPLDRVKLTDRTGTRSILTVVRGGEELPSGLGQAPAKGSCSVQDGVVVAEGTGLALPGYTLLADKDRSAGIQNELRSKLAGAVWGSQDEWEALRILRGRPYPGRELTPEVTPLEAGLWHTISFTKGCYLGQETIAKVANNHGERQRLFGFRCLGGAASAAEAGVVQGARLVTTEGTRAGAITSFLSYPSPTGETTVRGLAYVRKKMGDPGSKLLIDGTTTQVEVLEIPYATRTDVTSPVPAVEKAVAEVKTEASAELKAKEAERKAKKLEEMRKKLEAFQQKQKAQKGDAAQ